VPTTISVANPSCLLFLVDQSASMRESFGGQRTVITKAEGVSDAINRLLQNLVIKCAKSTGVRDYYFVGVLSYGEQVRPAFQGRLEKRELVPISEIADAPLRIEERTKLLDDGLGGLIKQTVKFPVWFEATAAGKTPMCTAIHYAQKIIQKWLSKHPDCFPPIVINITDGMATDGNPLKAAQTLKSLSSSSGQILFFNIHFSAQQANPIEFPDNEAILPNKYATLLFRMSSLLPTYLREIASQEYNIPISEKTRGFTFHADMVALIKFLDIGTRPAHFS
jgi:hypothetical protein